MPFFVTDDTPQVRPPSATPPPNPIRPTLTEVVGAAFSQDNPAVNVFRSATQQAFPPEDGHNPLDVIRGTKFEEQHLDNFIASMSEAETRATMARIDREEEERKLLDAAGFPGTVASISAGMADPTIFLPAGTIYRTAKGGYSLARTALSTGVASGAQAGIQESVLQATQETRSLGESTTAIASATILGGLIGTGASALLSRVERQMLERALDHERATIDAHANGLPAPVGAAAADTRTLELESSGLGATAGLSPTRRVLSSESTVARRTVADAFETPYRFKDDEVATQGPALDRLAKMAINGTRTQVSDELDRLFSEYRFGDPEARFPRMRAQFDRMMGNDTGLMTYHEFKQEVSRALIEGDQHAIPQVQQAAEAVRRRVFDPWKERAIKAGLLPEDVDVKTAESYFQRIYNKEAINARRPEFVNKVVSWLSSDQATKRAAQSRLKDLNDELQATRAQIERANSPEGAAEATARHDRIRAQIETEIAAWEGKSTADARSALKAREKYAADRAPPAEGETQSRLTQADAAIDKAVKDILESDRNLGVDELRARAHEITDNILGSPDGRLPYDMDSGGPGVGWKPGMTEPPRGPLARREFNIPDSEIRDFLEQDVEQVVATHLRTIVPDVLLTERFGDVRMTDPLKRIQEDYAAKIDATKSEKEATRLGKERDAVIRDIAAMRDRMRGIYGWSADLRNMARIANGAKAVNNLTSMGVAAISSLPDFAGAIFRYGFGSALGQGWAPFLSHMMGSNEAFGRFRTQMRAIGIGVEVATNARQHALDDVVDVYKPQSRFERGLQWTTDKFFIANLLAPLTDMQKTIAAHVAVSEIIRATKAVAEGKATKAQVANLAESGIDQHMANRIWEQFQKGGEVVDGVHLPNTADWTARDAADALNGAVARDVDIAVVTPGQEKPLWFSQPVLSIFSQFKAFTASATERILIANLQRRDAAVLQGLVASIGLGMLSYKVNSMFGGQKTSDRPQDWLKEGISRGGVMGWFEELNALSSKMTRGGVDVYRMIGADKPLSRFANRSVLDMFLGPTAGKISGLAKVTGAAASGDWNASDTTALRRLMAFQNLVWLRGALNQVEEGVNGKFGIEPAKPPEPQR